MSSHQIQAYSRASRTLYFIGWRLCLVAFLVSIIIVVHDFAPLFLTPWRGHMLNKQIESHHENVVSIAVFYYPIDRDAAAPVNYSAFDWSEAAHLNKYFTPLVNVILNWRWLLPDWKVRVYISQGHPYVSQLRRLGAEVIEKRFDPERWCAAMTWRFLVQDDATVEHWASRESESPPTIQDAAVLTDWTRPSVYPIHAIHVAGAHQTINGGLFGFNRAYLNHAMNTSMVETLERFQHEVDSPGRKFGDKYGDDQFFLAKRIWSLGVGRDGIAYESSDVRKLNRSFCNFKVCTEYPDSSEASDVFRCSMNRISQDELILCHHEDAPHCRRERFEQQQAWRELYELCTGRDFLTDELLDPSGVRLGMRTCPYSKAGAPRSWIERVSKGTK